ncbi:PCI domain-containing protein 2-like [Sycon ciliatum]|uniref:PCI domain-containing protein 2-like n=1 Tax=Sycon ciliatum TaxID=27933 RepID=UPI0031F6936C
MKMAHLTLVQYLQEVSGALSTEDGDHLAELVSYRHPHIQNPRLQLEDAESKCRKWIDQPFDEVVTAHLRLLWAAANNNYAEAYTCQAAALQSFLKLFQALKETNWPLPVMYTLILDLRTFAKWADKQQAHTKSGKPDEKLEKAADLLMNCFRACVADTRASFEVTKRWGTLPIVNNLFKIYFQINKVQLCKPLFRAIQASNLKDNFKVSHLVTYKYYLGRKALFDGSNKEATENLRFAFERCHRDNKRNKRLVLIFLVPVMMLQGRLPRPEVLQKYSLVQFMDIVTAVRQGNLLLLNSALAKHQEFFIRMGVYLILEKLKIIIYRNLFKKVYTILNTHQIPIASLLAALRMMQLDGVDPDETQCIVANLVDKGYIRGYISFQHQKLVVSKKDPFPNISTLLAANA